MYVWLTFGFLIFFASLGTGDVIFLRLLGVKGCHSALGSVFGLERGLYTRKSFSVAEKWDEVEPHRH